MLQATIRHICVHKTFRRGQRRIYQKHRSSTFKKALWKNIYTEELVILKKRNSFCLVWRGTKIPYLCIIRKFLENPPVGRPIVAGYNWILTPTSIFVGHFLKEFYSKFDLILTDSVTLIRILEDRKYNTNCFLFTINF